MADVKAPRPSWDSYFIRLAHEVSTRGTCDRKKVGCVLVLDRRIISAGYNGSPPGMPHCDDTDVGHDMLNGNCVRTIHAEQNAITQAAKFGTPLQGASAYVNTFPCWNCMKVLVGAGIKEIYYDDEYRNDERVRECAEKLGIVLQGPTHWNVTSASPL